MITKSYVLGLIMLIASALSFYLKPRVITSALHDSVELEKLIPTDMSSWKVDKSIIPILPSPDVQSKLDLIYSQTLSRTYRNESGNRVMLSIAYGSIQRDGLHIHRPEVCYAANGFSISKKSHFTYLLDNGISLPVIRMKAVSGDRHEVITYWVTIGKKVINSSFGRKIEQLRYGIRGEIPDAYLIRVSSLGRDKANEYKLHKDFILDMIENIDQIQRYRVIGAPPK